MTEILLDYDGSPPADIMERLEMLDSIGIELRRKPGWTTRTKHGWHMRFKVNGKLEPLEIVAVQAIMGSDWKREAFNLVRARGLARAPRFWRQKGRWNVLYAGKL